MMRLKTSLSGWASLVLACTSCLVGPAAPAADGALDYLPSDALGFVLVRDLTAAADGLDALASATELPLPPTLALLQTISGLGPGIDAHGDLLFAALPHPDAGQDAAAYIPLLLAPVEDYDQFAASLHADPAGEICRVALAGEEVLAARLGAFALLMNVEHEAVMARLLQAESQPLPALQTLQPWIARQHVVAVVLPEGIRMLSAAGRASLEAQAQATEEDFAALPDSALLEQVRQVLGWGSAALDFLGAQVATAGMGWRIDAQTNLVASGRVTLLEDAAAAELAFPATTDAAPLAALVDEPLIGAAGGPLPSGLARRLARASRDLMQQFPEAYGFTDFGKCDWENLEESTAAALEGVRNVAVVALPGKPGDAVYSNFYSLLEVDDADRYLASYRRSMTLWNDLIERSTSPTKVAYELSDVQLGDRPALLAEGNVAAAADDPNVPFMKDFMEAMFGEGGMLRMYLVKLDERRVWFAVGPAEQVAQSVARLESDAPRLTADAEVQQALDLIDPQAGWRAVVSPAGCVQWFGRLTSTLLANAALQAPPGPEFPTSPPVALSAHLETQEVQWEIAAPRATLAALAAYLRAMP